MRRSRSDEGKPHIARAAMKNKVGPSSLSWLLLLVLATCTALAEDSEQPEEAESHVITLTAENFDEIVKSEPVILVEFYAPW